MVSIHAKQRGTCLLFRAKRRLLFPVGPPAGVAQKRHRRGKLEQDFFVTDTALFAEYLGLPSAYPDPSPIAFKPGIIWGAEDHQPLNERLNQLYVEATRMGRGLEFLDRIGRMLWDGSTPNWDRGAQLATAMRAAGLDIDAVLEDTSNLRKRGVGHQCRSYAGSGPLGGALDGLQG
ncbi:MAG: hypothetical protein AB8B58_16860 [Roseobacter sp.]